MAQLDAMGIPTVETIGAACSALAALVRLGARRRRRSAVPAHASHRAARGIARPRPSATRATPRRCWPQAGIPVLREASATTRDEAVAAARAIGYPVVLKIVSPDIAHKTEVGGVVVGLRCEGELSDAHDRMLARVAQQGAACAHRRRAGGADGAGRHAS